MTEGGQEGLDTESILDYIVGMNIRQVLDRVARYPEDRVALQAYIQEFADQVGRTLAAEVTGISYANYTKYTNPHLDHQRARTERLAEAARKIVKYRSRHHS